MEGALWRRAWLDEHRVSAPPEGGFARAPVLALDPADGAAGGAEHAYAVAALGADRGLYVLESVGLRDSP